MSSRKSIQQVVSPTEPVGGSLGDEWLNPTTGVLRKLTLVNGVVQYIDVVTNNYNILQPVANVKFLDGAIRDTSWSAAVGNNIPVRHPDGYLYANYFNTPADKTTGVPSHIAIQTNSDNYIRWNTFAQFRTNLGIIDPVTLAASLRANRNISGGGTITVNGSGSVLWSTRFIVISNGRGTNFATSGYFDIACPTSGTITGVGGAGNQTATAAGVPVPDWHALYYILPIGSGEGTVAANFRVVQFTADVDIPHNWVLICLKNAESGYFHFPNGVNLKVNQNSTNLYTNGGSIVSNVTGTLSTTTTGANTTSLISANIADNDYFRILVGGTATNAGYAEIATADDGNEPIHVRQYTGAFATLTRTATILDASGNTSFPGSVTATGFSGPLTGNASTATSAGSATTAGSVTNAVTFNNAGTGDASGTTYNGSAIRTISYNSVGAPAYAQVAGSNFDFNNVFPATTTLNRVVWNTGDGNMLNSPNGNSTGVLLASQGSHGLWNAQMFFEQGSAGSMFIRGSDDASGTRAWGAWKKIVSSTNYTDYTVTKTGTGASGTWGISITGNAANVTGTVAVANGGTGVTSSTGTGSVVLSASPTFTGTVSAANLTLSGDLTINGTTTTINSTTVSVDDKNLELGSVASPTNTTADGGGITLKGATDKTFNWVNATAAWTSSEHIAQAAGKTHIFTGATSGTITLSPTAVAGTTTLTLPATTGTLVTTGDTATVSTTMLATVNSNVGSFGSASAIPVLTVNAKGLITAVSTATVSSLPTQTSNAGKFLTTDGSTASWTSTTAAAGGGIQVNNSTISTTYTIPAGSNGFSVGPITVANGTTITVSSGQRWVVI